MIPKIEDIFHSLSLGSMTFDDAEKYVRAHIRQAREANMDVREHFAALAMQGLFTAQIDFDSSDRMSETAYKMADAMVKELPK